MHVHFSGKLPDFNDFQGNNMPILIKFPIKRAFYRSVSLHENFQYFGLKS